MRTQLAITNHPIRAVVINLAAGHAGQINTNSTRAAVLVGYTGDANTAQRVTGRLRIITVIVRLAEKDAQAFETHVAKIVTIVVYFTFDAGAMVAHVIVAKQFTGAIPIIFTTLDALKIDTQVAQRAIVLGFTFYTLVSNLIAGTPGAVLVNPATFDTKVGFANQS